MIQGVYHTQVTKDEILEQKDIIEQTGAFSEFEIIPREDHVHVMLYPSFLEEGAIQVLGKGVINIWANDSKDLWAIVDCLNRLLGSQKVNEPIKVNELGAKPGFYVSKKRFFADMAELLWKSNSE